MSEDQAEAPLTEPEKKTKRAPLSATERIIDARDQQKRYVEKLSDRLQRKRLEVVAAETQYQSAYEELQRLEAALSPELRTNGASRPEGAEHA